MAICAVPSLLEYAGAKLPVLKLPLLVGSIHAELTQGPSSTLHPASVAFAQLDINLKDGEEMACRFAKQAVQRAHLGRKVGRELFDLGH
jgi:hypothetical protein